MRSVSRETMEGAGVRLHRAFGYHDIPAFDPFLMLDDFRADHPRDYLAGFPWHPHRGIETVTYMLEGMVEHGDSMGHSGTVEAGGIQWMTAGSGIIHQEMPKPVHGKMGGFQLWVNLPRSHKMMDPRYQEIPAMQIPEVTVKHGVRIRIICGMIGEITGPVRDILAEPEYFDVSLKEETQYDHLIKEGYTVAIYVIYGSGWFDPYSDDDVKNRTILRFDRKGDRISVRSGPQGVRYLFISGKPFHEPVAWGGPIVMNTQEELDQAFLDYQTGNFIRKNPDPTNIH